MSVCTRRFIFFAVFFSVFLPSLFSQMYPYYLYYYSIPRRLYVTLYNTAKMDDDSIDIDSRVMCFWYACEALRDADGVEVILEGGLGAWEISERVAGLFADNKAKGLEVAEGLGRGNAYFFTGPGKRSRLYGEMADVMFMFSGPRLRWFIPKMDWPSGPPK